MPDTRRTIDSPPGFRSHEAGSFFSQLEDQSRRLSTDSRGLSPAELEWQPAPGMNSIGMLLAHIAIVEVYWVQIALGREVDIPGVLGIGEDDDGIPLPEGGPPPGTLHGRDLAFFDDLLARARAYARAALAGLADADLDREVVRRRRNGATEATSLRWIFYHLVEHEAGHYGQINLLRHLLRVGVSAR